MFGPTIEMGEAAIITVFSMAIVFITLLTISFILDLFKIIFVEKKKPVVAQSEPQGKVEIEPKPTVEEDEEALIAVITAAIVAATGKPKEKLIIRSITPIYNPESSWTRMGRIEQMR